MTDYRSCLSVALFGLSAATGRTLLVHLALGEAIAVRPTFTFE